ncbi:MAG: hypothetical protein ACREOW_16320 [Thermodesulfobacteriota bacterium]
MSPEDEIFRNLTKWLNENQGVVAVLIFALTILFGWFSGLFKLIFGKLFDKQKQPYIQSGGDSKSGGPIIVGNENIIIQALDFSGLGKQVNAMESKLQQVLESMRRQDSINQTVSPPIPSITNSEDYRKVLQIISGDPSPENKTKLKTIYYSARDKIAKLQIILSLADWSAPQDDDLDDLIALCDDGIKIADEKNAKEEKAILLAYKGKFVSIQFADLDMETASNIHATNSFGIPLITEEERQKVIEKLNYLDKSSEKCFNEAEKVAKESKSFKALGSVYMQIGSAAGHRFIHLNHFGVDRAKQEKQLAKRAFMLAKEIYSLAGDELQIAYVFYNLANQLRGFGENDEAKELLYKVVEIATKHNEYKLLKYAHILLERIESGNIPDYMHGEKFNG